MGKRFAEQLEDMRGKTRKLDIDYHHCSYDLKGRCAETGYCSDDCLTGIDTDHEDKNYYR
jgi:hypothetical protein